MKARLWGKVNIYHKVTFFTMISLLHMSAARLRIGKHQWLHGRESEWTPGVGDGQGGLACCDSWGRKKSDTTERLNWTEWSLSENTKHQATRHQVSTGRIKNKIQSPPSRNLWMAILIPHSMFIIKKKKKKPNDRVSPSLSWENLVRCKRK